MLLRKATSLLQPSSCTGSNRQGTSSFQSLWLQWSFLSVCWFMIYRWFMEAYFRFRIAFYLMLLRPSVWGAQEKERFHGIKTCKSHLWWEIGLWISKYRTQLPWSSRESSMIKRNDFSGHLDLEPGFPFQILETLRFWLGCAWLWLKRALNGCSWVLERYLGERFKRAFWRTVAFETRSSHAIYVVNTVCRSLMFFEDVQQLFAFFMILISMFCQ